MTEPSVGLSIVIPWHLKATRLKTCEGSWACGPVGMPLIGTLRNTAGDGAPKLPIAGFASLGGGQNAALKRKRAALSDTSPAAFGQA
jgi:hypothetical protein